MIVTIMQPLLNAGSKLMNVNGTTPKTFTYSPGGILVQEVVGLVCLLKDDGATTFAKFGAITAITNGLQIQWSIGGNAQNYALVKDNADLTQAFPDDQHFGNSATLSLLGIATPEGFGNSNNVFKGKIEFVTPILLTGSDAINVIVQDDLSAVDVLQIAAIIELDL